MKKLLLTVLVLMFAAALYACTKEEGDVDYSHEDYEALYSEDESLRNYEDHDATKQGESSDKSSNASDISWREFLDEYSMWVDEYVDIADKYKNNPTDMTLLTEYTKLMGDMAEWADKADKIQAELEDVSPSEAMEYAAELSKIAMKLTKIAY